MGRGGGRECSMAMSTCCLQRTWVQFLAFTGWLTTGLSITLVPRDLRPSSDLSRHQAHNLGVLTYREGNNTHTQNNKINRSKRNVHGCGFNSSTGRQMGRSVNSKLVMAGVRHGLKANQNVTKI